MDRVLVSSGEGGGPKWKLAHTVCHANQTYNPPFATSNYMLVNFLSDWRTNGTGFQATVLSSKTPHTINVTEVEVFHFLP